MSLRTNRPRTIQIYLPDGDPSGIRIAELTTSIIRVIEVPRSELAKFREMPESQQVGLYFLVSADRNELYIGQSGDVGTRLLQHHKEDKKDWERALVQISLTNNLTQTHALYLESLSIERARDCSRYELLNGNNGQKPHTPVPLKADCDEMHELGSLLLATLGYPIFESSTKVSSEKEQQVFYLTRAGTNARSLYTNQGMVILAGSSAPLKTLRKPDPRMIEIKDELLRRGILEIHDERFVFTKNHIFKTPSGASGLLLQGSSNGWIDWKTEQGITLNDYQGR